MQMIPILLQNNSKKQNSSNDYRNIFSQGYGSGRNAPGKKGIGTYSYISAHNQIRAHAYAYR